MRQQYILAHKPARMGAIQAVQDAPDGYVVEIKEPTRKLSQNAKFHAILTDISRQAQYIGKKRSIEFWKGLFVSGWQIATGEKPDIVPGLEGEFINIRESTATMSVRNLSSLMEYVIAWAIDNGIQLTDPVPDEYADWAKR
jgi:hypothetical protein